MSCGQFGKKGCLAGIRRAGVPRGTKGAERGKMVEFAELDLD